MEPVSVRNSVGRSAVQGRARHQKRLVLGGVGSVLFAAMMVALPRAAAACSVAAGYTAPTNLEIAASAHAIVLAEVVGEAVIDASDSEDQRGISLRPLRMLKGLMPQDALVLPGMALSGSRDLGDPLELAAPHLDSFSGSCIRRAFSLGQVALFFLRREEGFWRPAGASFSRWAEDVTSEDAPWLALAGLYTHAGRLPAGQQRALLEDQEEALRAREDDDVAQVMADDIARQLAGLDRSPLPAQPELSTGSSSVEKASGLSVEEALDALTEGRTALNKEYWPASAGFL